MISLSDQTPKKKLKNRPKKRLIKKTSKARRRAKQDEIESDTDSEERERIANGEPCQFDKMLMMKLTNSLSKLYGLQESIKQKTASYKRQFLREQGHTIFTQKSEIPEASIPVCADVRNFDFQKLAETQKKITGRLFDVIMMDPPWQLATAQPSRGVAIGYSSLNDEHIRKLPVGQLQESGLLLIWVINAKFGMATEMMEAWGYRLVDEIAWVKRTVTGKIAKGHGFYLQHAKETCLVGFKGDFQDFLIRRHCLAEGIDLSEIERVKKEKGDEVVKGWRSIREDVIFSERRGQSQKPNEIYDIVEKMVPNGFYLEIFGRRNNLHANWVTLGNEL